MRLKETLKVLAAAAAVATSTAGAAGTVQAEGPLVVPPAPAEDSFVIPANDACPFDVEITVVGGKGGAIFFGDGRAHFFSPGLALQLTNVSVPDGPTVRINSTGSFHDRPGEETDAGFVFDTTMVGHNLLFGPFVDEEGDQAVGMRSFIGKATLTITDDGALYTFSNIDARSARVTDMCAALAD